MVVRMTALVVTGDVEACLQRPQCRSVQSLPGLTLCLRKIRNKMTRDFNSILLPCGTATPEHNHIFLDFSWFVTELVTNHVPGTDISGWQIMCHFEELGHESGVLSHDKISWQKSQFCSWIGCLHTQHTHFYLINEKITSDTCCDYFHQSLLPFELV